jgi:hypothetical protein
MLRRSLDGRWSTAVYFEVPSVHHTLREAAIWDIIYEHYSYFSRGSLAQALTRCGFTVCELGEAFEGQYLWLEAVLADDPVGYPPDRSGHPTVHASTAAAFSKACWRKVEAWNLMVREVVGDGRRAVVWGAGSKGVTFLNLLQTEGQIEYVVDINPRKHWHYIAGTGQQIVPPEFLRQYRPDVVIVMNPIYQNEIQRLAEQIGVTAVFLRA